MAALGKETSLLDCMMVAWSQTKGNLPGNKKLIIRLVTMPILVIPMVYLIRYNDRGLTEARALIAGAYLLFVSMDKIHASLLIKSLPGIENKDRLDAGFKSFSVIGYFLAFIFLSLALMIGAPYADP